MTPNRQAQARKRASHGVSRLILYSPRQHSQVLDRTIPCFLFDPYSLSGFMGKRGTDRSASAIKDNPATKGVRYIRRN